MKSYSEINYLRLLIRFTFFYLSIFAIILSTFIPRCFSQVASKTEYKYKIPVQLDDGWKTGSLEEVNIDTEAENQFYFNPNGLEIKFPIFFIEDNNGKIKNLVLYIGFNGYEFAKVE